MSAPAFEALKRGTDIIGSAVMLLVTAPIQAGIAAAVAHKLGRPILFRQQRPGKGGQPFTLLKFRTMLPADESKGLVSDEDRLTRFGRLLRSTSMDELPTLWNVLKGEMSLVGPRPLLMQYLERYTPEQARRHEVRPGVTGLAQVSGRNALTWEDKFRLDIEYVDRRSLQLDLSILLKTVRSVLRREGISQVGHATMTEFGAGDPGSTAT